MQSEQETADRAEMLLHVDTPPAPSVGDEGVEKARLTSA